MSARRSAGVALFEKFNCATDPALLANALSAGLTFGLHDLLRLCVQDNLLPILSKISTNRLGWMLARLLQTFRDLDTRHVALALLTAAGSSASAVAWCAASVLMRGKLKWREVLQPFLGDPERMAATHPLGRSYLTLCLRGAMFDLSPARLLNWALTPEWAHAWVDVASGRQWLPRSATTALQVAATVQLLDRMSELGCPPQPLALEHVVRQALVPAGDDAAPLRDGVLRWPALGLPGTTLLVGLAVMRQTAALRRLVDLGVRAVPNAQGEPPLAALLTALHMRPSHYRMRRDVLDVMLAAGADVNAARPSDGLTALHLAAMTPTRLLHEVPLLLACGANPNLYAHDGRTPLACALPGSLSDGKLLVAATTVPPTRPTIVPQWDGAEMQAPTGKITELRAADRDTVRCSSSVLCSSDERDRGRRWW
jgi:hypothetical protein